MMDGDSCVLLVFGPRHSSDDFNGILLAPLLITGHSLALQAQNLSPE
jgi:hypothetical protein